MSACRLRWLLPALLVVLCIPARASEDALREGNRRFRQGNLEAAFEAYQAGYGGDDPVLAYNLGTTAHHLGRLPEAVLWYRRAAEDGGGDVDRWLAQNLQNARRALDARRLPPPAPWSFLEAYRYPVAWIAVGLAWIAVGLLLAARRRGSRGPVHLADGAGGLALLLFLLAALSGTLAPTPAVLLEPCGSGEDRLVAGSEVWGRAAPDGSFRIVRFDGSELACLEGSVGRVRPAASIFLLR